MSKLLNKMFFKALATKNNALKLLKNEKGETNLIAIILILAVVIALVVIFKDYIAEIFDKIWEAIGGDVDEALE